MHINRRTFLSSLTGLAGLATLPASASNTPISFRQAFDRPAAQAKPWVRWWWPGGVVNDEELRREIKVLKLAGFGGAEVQAFNPGIPNLTKEERTRLHDYANDAFFAHLQVCTDEARRHDMQIDSTFGSAWPSGGGFAITPELALLELTPALTSITAPLKEPIRVTIPGNTRKFGALPALDARTQDPRAKDWRERMTARQKLVAVVAFRGEAPVLANNKNYRTAKVQAAGSMDTPAGIVLTDKLGPDGVLNWVPPSDGNWQIVVFKQFAVDSAVMAGVGEGPQLVLDHFNRAAFAAHAQRVGDPLKQAGRGLRATFIDSLELMPDIYWSENLLAEFQARRGYDLTPHLPHLMQPGWMEAWNPHTSLPYFAAGDEGERIRADYRLTISELLIENLWQPFIEWNHQRGLQARVQAHGGPSDLLQSYGLADIPETEDLESGASPHFLRLARAAANLYGRQLVGCESLCWPGKSYDLTPAQWQARINLLLASGVNAIVMHGFPYALHQDAWPGWYPFAPSPFLAGFSSMISETNPLWHAISGLNTYITRMQSIMQHGRNVVPMAVYFAEIGYFHGMEPKATDELLQALLDDGYDYDRINDDCLLKGRVVDGALLMPSGARYAALVLPTHSGIRPATAEQLAALAKAGLKIFFVDRPPSRAEGYLDHQRNDSLVQQSMQACLNAGASIVPGASLPAALGHAAVRANLTFTSKPCLFIEKSLDGQRAYFLHNPKDQAVTVSFVTSVAGHPERWDASDGSRSGLPWRQVRGGCEVTLELSPGGAALIVMTAGQLPVLPDYADLSEIDLSRRNWTLNVRGHGRKGRQVAQDLSLDRLRDWSELDGLADVSGQGDYQVSVRMPDAWPQRGQQAWLELGTVHDMAEVSVNGAKSGTLIASPYRIDITGQLRAGSNQLTVSVMNSPNNAMIDPKLPGLKDLKQKPAGLLGPVKLIIRQRKAAL